MSSVEGRIAATGCKKATREKIRASLLYEFRRYQSILRNVGLERTLLLQKSYI